jgi:opacity protein-like surface antigen
LNSATYCEYNETTANYDASDRSTPAEACSFNKGREASNKEDFMRRKLSIGIGLLAFAAAGAGSAVAADLPVRTAPPPPAAAPAFISDWAGFYVGIHGGGGWGHKDFEPSAFEATDSLTLFSPNASPKGGVFGFQFGHNWQWGPVVGGLEIDYSGANINETGTFFFLEPDDSDIFRHALTREVKIDSLASVRGRLGYLIFPNWLLYGTAGIGWAHERLTATETEFFLAGGASESVNLNDSFANEFGWVAGVGLEWKFWPGSSSWLLRGEWLHYDFGRSTHAGQDIIPDVNVFNVRTTVDVARAALSYKF